MPFNPTLEVGVFAHDAEGNILCGFGHADCIKTIGAREAWRQAYHAARALKDRENDDTLSAALFWRTPGNQKLIIHTWGVR